MFEEKHRIESVQRAFKAQMCLAGHEMEGLAPSQIAKATHMSATQTTRTMANLEIAGIAEKITSNDRWRLAPRIVQIAIAHTNAMDKADKKLSETKNRYSREV
ncbi:MAG: hypothetical protein COA54_02375 [Thiotrichaceae bacterium]|nr:MAG: hypothetical protein COA54_02375 [Thiotrichaceae bacterium]